MANCCVRIGCVKSRPSFHPPGRCVSTTIRCFQKATSVALVNRLQHHDYRRLLPRCPNLGHSGCSTRFVRVDLHLLRFGRSVRTVHASQHNLLQTLEVRSSPRLMRDSDRGFRFPGSVTEETDELIPLWKLPLPIPTTSLSNGSIGLVSTIQNRRREIFG